MWYLFASLIIGFLWALLYQVYFNVLIQQALANFFGSFPNSFKFLLCGLFFLMNFLFTILFLSVCSSKLVILIRNHIISHKEKE